MDAATPGPRPSRRTSTAVVVCGTCGATAPDDGMWRLTWTTAHERGQTVFTCDRCSREHLRSIEAKLNTDWW